MVLLNKPDMDNCATELEIYIGDAKEDNEGRIESEGIDTDWLVKLEAQRCLHHSSLVRLTSSGLDSTLD